MTLKALELAWPYTLLALPLPLLLHWLLPRTKQQPGAALKVPFFAAIYNTEQLTKIKKIPVFLGLLIWLLLVLAASRPQIIGKVIELPLTGRDLLLAVDISGSMRTEDLSINERAISRLHVVRSIAGDFISRRQGDRLGLILFGSQAYLQTPLTFDHRTVRTHLEEAEIGLAGRETAIGNAIGLAVKRLHNNSQSNRVLILLTDGANNAGEIDPLRATDLAAQQGLRIYTIGIGAEQMTVRNAFGTNQINPSADLDEDMLRKVADHSGGRYFRARNTADLEDIYQLLDQLEPLEVDQGMFRPVRELYYWPLALALLCSIGLAFFGHVNLRQGTA